MPSEAYILFIDSIVRALVNGALGSGYGLKALMRLGPEKRASNEELMIRNLKQGSDWYDVKAFAALGPTSACAAVNKVRFRYKTIVRNYTLRI